MCFAKAAIRWLPADGAERRVIPWLHFPLLPMERGVATPAQRLNVLRRVVRLVPVLVMRLPAIRRTAHLALILQELPRPMVVRLWLGLRIRTAQAAELPPLENRNVLQSRSVHLARHQRFAVRALLRLFYFSLHGLTPLATKDSQSFA